MTSCERLAVNMLLLLACIPMAMAAKLEYCESEVFRARCRQNEAIVIESALYGRMNLGRCVKADLGYLGCTTDVLHLADKRCSGRRECDIRIPDAELDATNACFKELKTYLEASYSCVPVALADVKRCHGNAPVPLTDTAGFLGSVIAEESRCGSARSPWLITALEGQQINLTLYDFSIDHAIDVQRYPAGSECVQYGVIEEPDTSVRMAVCRGNKRVRHLYQSRSNKLLVHITQDRDGKTSGYFLIKFEIIGCPKSYETSQDSVTSEEMEELRDLFPGCRETSTKTPKIPLLQASKAPCMEANCTHSTNKISKNSHSSTKNQDMVFLGQGLSAIIIASITVVVSLIIVLLGAVILKCTRARRMRRRLPVAVEQDASQCVYSERPETTYSAAPLYECKAFSPISPCDRCMSQINVNTYTTHYWDYIKDATIGSSQIADTTGCLESETSGILLKNLHMSSKANDDTNGYPVEDSDERENETNTYRQCQYGCRLYTGEATTPRNGGLYGSADDTKRSST